ncbi:aspartate aminotransferase family protein [Haloechinothrix sp. LS1_15]|uniref:aspartate aminotransferase family protein n=1 Tax=Haloechinothrix sp. LS1_15 TaxID=2652248 RepID=UPI002945720D|nr:aspartate aminotransferase family protein [Haloechinothrix sp. LS1_15]MDV6011899.1 aspartate aminotransferase family protein [Haloechinothrix sp. LS1_15]
MPHDELLRRHRAVMPDWLTLYYDAPIEITGGNGRHVTDGEGRTYLDFFAGILTNALGYGVPEIGAAVSGQLDTGVVHTSTLYLIRQQVALAERIAELSGIPDAKVFFTSSGTEANEAALLLATQYRRSNQVLALRNSYHGRAFATMGVTGNRGWSASALSPVQVSYVHGGYRLRGPLAGLSDADYIDACVADLREVLATTTSGDVACLIAEPVQGVGGFATPPDGLLGAYREVLDEHGILLISDEVQTGWGRTGEHFWGIGAHGTTPDAMTFAKGLGNGFAIGGVVARAELMDCLSANSISTFGGNPLATAAASATLDYVLDHDLQANAAERGAYLAGRLREAQQRHPVIGEVRGKGLMLGVELVDPGTTDPAPGVATAVLEATRAAGLLIGKGGLHGNVLRIAPPMTLTDDEAAEGARILVDAIATVDKELAA